MVKARRLPLEWSPVRDSTLVGSSLACIYSPEWKYIEVANTLAYYITVIITSLKGSLVQAPNETV